MSLNSFDVTRRTPLGQTEIRISPIAFGCWGISSKNWGEEPNKKDAIKVLDAAWADGINLFDTAAVYGGGFGEFILGEVSWKNDAVISTKVSAKQKPLQPIAALNQYYGSQYVINEVDKSLRRLERDYIDILHLHNWFDEWMPDADYLFEILDQLKQQGKVRAVGLSVPDWSNANVCDILGKRIIDVLQLPLNLFQQWATKQVIPVANQLGVGILARSPLSQGALGSLAYNIESRPENDFRKRRYGGSNLTTYMSRLQHICELVGITQIELPYYSIAYCLSQPGVSAAIIGMRTLAHIKENTKPSNYQFTTVQIKNGQEFDQGYPRFF